LDLKTAFISRLLGLTSREDHEQYFRPSKFSTEFFMRNVLNSVCLLSLVMAIGCGPSSEYPTANSTTASSTEVAAPPPVPTESTQWTQLMIPAMKSVKDDWPKVEASLKAQSGVKEVRYKPTDNDTIPESIALIQHTTEFDAKKAAEALGEAGYKDASVKGF
jgi:hypothetical protein